MCLTHTRTYTFSGCGRILLRFVERVAQVRGMTNNYYRIHPPLPPKGQKRVLDPRDIFHFDDRSKASSESAYMAALDRIIWHHPDAYIAVWRRRNKGRTAALPRIGDL